jgi:Uma2 family endonuclease
MPSSIQRADMTADEFLIWNLSQDQRYELVDGVPVPLRAPLFGMSGASAFHDEIVVNIIAALREKLRAAGCSPRTPDTAVRTAIKRVRRPDVTIECAPPTAGSYEARNPVAVFEVLSPSTRKTDLLVKHGEYTRHPTIRMIVSIDPDVVDVVVSTRTDEGAWSDVRLETLADHFVIATTGVPLSLTEIYAGLPYIRETT